MSNWQVTAKTIYCDAVDDEVTVLIYKDFSARCTGCKKYQDPDELTRQLIKRKQRKNRRPIKCEGEDCPRVMSYKAKIQAEEKV